MIKNWSVGITEAILDDIYLKDINVAIYNRDIKNIKKEIDFLLKRNTLFNDTGTTEDILDKFNKKIPSDKFPFITNDVKNLLIIFKRVTKKTHFKLLLGSITTNMCRKFHTDNNTLRMLCTYSGAGTLWLPKENINLEALENFGSNEEIVIDKNNIKQANTGAVIILKGEKYSDDTQAAVHKSPSIESKRGKRLLLRIDTNEFLKTC